MRPETDLRRSESICFFPVYTFVGYIASVPEKIIIIKIGIGSLEPCNVNEAIY